MKFRPILFFLLCYVLCVPTALSAVRAVWDCWQTGAKLDVKGPHYNINLMVPLFNPGPITAAP